MRWYLEMDPIWTDNCELDPEELVSGAGDTSFVGNHDNDLDLVADSPVNEEDDDDDDAGVEDEDEDEEDGEPAAKKSIIAAPHHKRKVVRSTTQAMSQVGIFLVSNFWLAIELLVLSN